MLDSEKSDEWVARVLQQNPCRLLDDGNVRTCPVRLSFPHVFKKGDPVEAGKPGAYSASLVFPLGADLSVLKKAAADAAIAKWPQAASGNMKMKGPFLDQADYSQYSPFEAGGTFIRAVAYENKPRVFDGRMVPITDESRVYPGVWAVAIIRFFAYDKGVNKGVSAGLNALMIVADDKQLGGGAIDAHKAFGGVSIDAEVNPAAGFSDPAAASLFE